jgi:hypothetical protein
MLDIQSFIGIFFLIIALVIAILVCTSERLNNPNVHVHKPLAVNMI